MRGFEERDVGRTIRQFVAGAVGVVIFIAFMLLSFGTWYTVDQGERGVLTRMGALRAVSEPGFHFKLPWVDSVDTIDVRTTTFEWDGKSRMETYSKDQQPADLSVKVTYHVNADDASVRDLYTQYRTRDNFEAAVMYPRVLEGIKTVFGRFNAVTAIQERARLNREVEELVRTLVKGPVTIEGVQIQDIAFSDAYEQAVEERMKAQVEVERLTMNLERERKQAEIKVVQANAEQASLEAIGKGTAAAINLRGEALRNNPQLVEFTLAEKWNGELPTTMVPGTTVPFLDLKK